MIKRFAYDYSKTKDDKSNFIEMLFHLITSDDIDFACKDLLSSALEYQFNEDQCIFLTKIENRYRQMVMDKVMNMIVVP